MTPREAGTTTRPRGSSRTCRSLVATPLRRNPRWLEGGSFDIEPTRGLLGRWLHKRRVEREMQMPAPRPRTAPSPAKQRYLEEAKALVEDTLERTS